MLTKTDLSQIKTVVQETIRPQIETLKKNMATKDDLKGMATKDDLKGMATKDDLKGMATKDDLKGMATKDDLKGMATKDDLKKLETGLRGELETGLKGLEKRLIEKIEESEMEIITVVDKHKEDKETVRVLEKRVDRLEDNAGLPPLPNQ